jgi:hypothetical protein
VVVAVLAVWGSGGGPSIIARASAAISANNAILHFVEILHTGPPVTVMRREVWELGTRLHDVSTQTTRGHRVTMEQVRSGRNGRFIESYFDGTIQKLTLPPAAAAHAMTCQGRMAIAPRCLAGPGVDLVAVLRRLYGSGHVHFAGQTTFDGRRVDVFVANGQPIGARRANGFPQARFRVLVDAGTLFPVEIQYTSGQAGGSTATVQFQRLPITAQNEKLLQLRPHPHAQICASTCLHGDTGDHPHPPTRLRK